MNIPKKLKIGGHEYKIIFPHTYTERFDRLGDHSSDFNIIRLAGYGGETKLPESSIAVTFLHEILHAIDAVSGQDMFEGEEGEKRIEALSEGLYQVLKDNKLRFDK